MAGMDQRVIAGSETPARVMRRLSMLGLRMLRLDLLTLLTVGMRRAWIFVRPALDGTA
jgi:hypothetical protein